MRKADSIMQRDGLEEEDRSLSTQGRFSRQNRGGDGFHSMGYLYEKNLEMLHASYMYYFYGRGYGRKTVCIDNVKKIRIFQADQVRNGG